MVVGPRRAWTDPLAACGLLRGNRSLVEDFRQVSWLARYLAEHAAMWPTDPHADGSSDRADSDVANRFLDCWNEERERRLTAEREEYLTRRMMDFAWSIALPGVARRDRGVVESILAAARLEKHNTLARVVAAARALASGDASAAAELRLAVAALDADPRVDLPLPADGPLPPRTPLPLTSGVSAAPDSGGEGE